MLDSSYQRVKTLFLLMIIQQAMTIKFLLILSKNISFQEQKLKITILKLMDKMFMIRQLMTQLNNATRSEKYQQDKVMIIQPVVFGFSLFWKKYRLIATNLSKQKPLDADSRATQQIIFTDKITASVANTWVKIYHSLEQ